MPTVPLPAVPLPAVPLPDRAGPCRAFRARGIVRFDQAAAHVHRLPYGRAADVLAEGRGTCSSKHALLVRLGRALGLDIRLMLGLVRLDAASAPAVGPVLAAQGRGLAFVPEAHCWLELDGQSWDLTFPDQPPGPLRTVPLVARSWPPTPAALAEKPAWHRAQLAHHLPPGWTVDALWALREACIAALATAAP